MRSQPRRTFDAGETRRRRQVLALFTPEQQMLGKVVTDIAASIGLENPNDLESVSGDRGWSELQSVGLLGLRLREGGAPGASGVEAMIAAEALAARLVPQPFLGAAVLPSELLALAGDGSERQGEIAEGNARGCILLSSALRELASPPFDGSVAWDCEGAQFALGVDVSSGRVTSHPVTTLEPLEAADLTRTVAKISTGPPEEVGEISAADLDRWCALALVVVSADVVGAMRGGLDGAVAYSKERVQFGVPVGSFQAVQHLCAEALAKLEGAASTVKYAAWAVDELDPSEALLAARTAKAYAASVARDVGETVMQVYGGIGQTWEHIAHFYLRRQMVTSQVLGDGAAQLAAIADTRLGAV
jgi:Acyl-CoA dehydrogenase, C-terminal domain